MISEMWLITNYSCNNRCKWCYTSSKDFVNENMPLEYAKETLKEMSKNGVKKCTLIGGEPTVYPHLEELIRYGKENGLFMKIVSNAVLLSDINYVRRLKEAGLSLIAISIHGITRESYKNNTQTDYFNKVVEAIKNCNEENLDYVTLSTLNRLNKHEVVDIAEFLTSIGVKNIIFNIAVPNSKDKSVENIVLNPREIARVIEENYLKLKERNIRAGFYESIPLCLFDKELLEKMIEEKYLISLSKGGCNIYYESGFAFDPKGKVLPCCKKVQEEIAETMTEDKCFKYKDNYNQLWYEIKEHFGEKAMPFPSEKCYSCDMKENCIGGCPMFWEYFNPEEYVKQ